MTRYPITGVANAGGGATILARVLGNTGIPITQATIAGISYAVTDLSAGTTTAPVALPVASSVYQTLQQGDPRWLLDSQLSPGPDGAWGYNFAAALPANTFPLAAAQQVPPGYPGASGKQYQVDVMFTPVSGVVFKLPPVIVSVPAAYG